MESFLAKRNFAASELSREFLFVVSVSVAAPKWYCMCYRSSRKINVRNVLVWRFLCFDESLVRFDYKSFREIPNENIPRDRAWWPWGRWPLVADSEVMIHFKLSPLARRRRNMSIPVRSDINMSDLQSHTHISVSHITDCVYFLAYYSRGIFSRKINVTYYNHAARQNFPIF